MPRAKIKTEKITYVVLHRMKDETRVIPLDEKESIDELIEAKWRVAKVFSHKHEVKS